MHQSVDFNELAFFAAQPEVFSEFPREVHREYAMLEPPVSCAREHYVDLAQLYDSPYPL